MAGGTGDIAFRIVEASHGHAHATVLDINGSMLAVGRDRAEKKGLSGNTDFVEANAEELPFADATFDAYTIAFGIRNVPRIDVALSEAFRVLKPGGRFLCLEFSEVEMPLLDKAYEAWSFNAIPKIGKMVTGDGEPYSYLVESIAQIPQPAEFRGDDFPRRLRPRFLPQLFRRHRGAAFGLEALRLDRISHSRYGLAGSKNRQDGPGHEHRRRRISARTGRLGAGARGRRRRPAGRGTDRPAEIRLARWRGCSPAAARWPMSAATGWPRRWSGSGPPTSSSASSWRRGPTSSATTWRSTSPCCRTRCTPSRKAEAVAAIEASLGRKIGDLYAEFGDPVAAASIAQVHAADTVA